VSLRRRVKMRLGRHAQRWARLADRIHFALLPVAPNDERRRDALVRYWLGVGP